jgi:Tfp pilus assembly protein PilO
MRTQLRGADRLWLAGGAVVAVALAALSWFFLISPQRGETEAVQAEAAQVNDQATVLRARIAQLQKDNEKLDQLKAELAAKREALPLSTALSDFLRDLDDTGKQTGVSVTAVNAGASGTTHAAGAEFQILPVTLTVGGSADGQIAFLDHLRRVQPRAVLIIGINLVPADNSSSLTGTVTMTLSVQIFVAVEPTPAPSASAATVPSASPTN